LLFVSSFLDAIEKVDMVQTRAGKRKKGLGADRHSHDQCIPALSDQLPSSVTPSVVAQVTEKMEVERLGPWTSEMSRWILDMHNNVCRCGQVGVHCCPRTVVLGEADYNVHIVAQEYVFRALALLPLCSSLVGDNAIADAVQVQSVAVQTEEVLEEEPQEVALQAVQDQGQVRTKKKESSVERRIRRLEAKKRKKLKVEAAEPPLLPFHSRL
jgi:hypothetical protein